MEMKKFVGKSMKEVLWQVKEIFGPDAMILSEQSTAHGVEIYAAASPALPASDLSGLDSSLRIAQDPQANTIMHQLRNELNSLRHLVETQLDSIAWGHYQYQHPYQSLAIKKLIGMGVHLPTAKFIVKQALSDRDFTVYWKNILTSMRAQITTYSSDLFDQSGIVALVGPTGVGKTTTIAKIAARFALRHGSNELALITTDCYRIGAPEQLRIYGKILDVPVRLAETGEQLRELLHLYRDKKLILIDTVGTSQKELTLLENLLQQFEHPSKVKFFLNLSATSQYQVLQQSVQAFSFLSLTGVIPTKLDEAYQLGELMSVLINSGLPIPFYTDGQRVPQDIKVAHAEDLMQLFVRSSFLAEEELQEQLAYTSKEI